MPINRKIGENIGVSVRKGIMAKMTERKGGFKRARKASEKMGSFRTEDLERKRGLGSYSNDVAHWVQEIKANQRGVLQADLWEEYQTDKGVR